MSIFVEIFTKHIDFTCSCNINRDPKKNIALYNLMKTIQQLKHFYHKNQNKFESKNSEHFFVASTVIGTKFIKCIQCLFTRAIC